MASISTDANGNRRILFVDKARKRRCIRLGKLPMKSAELIATKVEALNGASTAGNSPDREVAEWLRTRDRLLYDKLAAVGLAPERAGRDISTLGLFLDRYLSTRNDVKPSTREHLEHTVRIWSITSAPASCLRTSPRATLTSSGYTSPRRWAITRCALPAGRTKQFFRGSAQAADRSKPVRRHARYRREGQQGDANTS